MPSSIGSFPLTVQVSDSASPMQMDTQALTLTIVPAPPQPLNITTTSLANGTVGQPYNVSLQATGGTTPYTWSLVTGSLPAGLTLSLGAGAITGTPTQAGNFSFTVQVTDTSTPPQTDTQALTLVIAYVSTPLTITTTTLPQGTVGISYSTTLQATGGTLPYTWSLNPGSSLPPGLTLSPSGTLSGIPTLANLFSFTVQVTDSSSPTPQSATKVLNLIIDYPVSALTITTMTLPAGTVGSAYSVTLQATGGSPPYTWSLNPGSTLPPGLTLSPNGTLSGIPTLANTFSFTVKVTDSSSPVQTDTQVLDLTINVTCAAADLNGDGGVNVDDFLLMLAVWGPCPPNSACPADLNGDDQISSPDQTLLGEAMQYCPPQGEDEPLTIITTSLPDATVGEAYSASLQASGGIPPYSWSLPSSGSLPPGLSLSGNGTISGTPTQAGSSNITTLATDSSSPQNLAIKTVSLTIHPGGGPCAPVYDHDFTPSTQPFTINWDQFGEFYLPEGVTVVYEGPNLNGFGAQDDLAPLSHGFSHVTFLGTTPQGRAASTPAQRAIFWPQVQVVGPAGFSPWRDAAIPWNNDLEAYQAYWTAQMSNAANGYPDSQGQPLPNVSLIVSDIERAHFSDADILSIKTHPAVPPEIAALPDEEFIDRYKRDMAALYTVPHEFLTQQLGFQGRVSSYGEPPIHRTWWNIDNFSWTDWITNPQHLNYLLMDYPDPSPNWLQTYGPLYERFTDIAPSAYFFYDYPETHAQNPGMWNQAADYVAYLLFQIEVNQAWSDKPPLTFVLLRYHDSGVDGGQFIQPHMAHATPIFAAMAGSGLWLWDYYDSQGVGDPTLNYATYEHFISGLHRIAQHSELLEGNIERYHPPEQNPRDLMITNQPVWRAVVNHDQCKILVAAHHPYQCPDSTTTIPITYAGTSVGTMTIEGLNTALTVFDLPGCSIGQTPLTITTTTLPPATVGAAYPVTLQATGGTPPYTWSLNPGSSLPPGLGLSPDGTIGGTPTQAGTFSFTVKVTDSSTPVQTDTQALSLTINPSSVTCAAADLNGDGIVDGMDQATLVAAFGACPANVECPADLTADGVVNVDDLIVLLQFWGPCKAP